MLLLFLCVLLCPSPLTSPFLTVDKTLIKWNIYHHSACWALAFQDETSMFWLVQVLSVHPVFGFGFDNSVGIDKARLNFKSDGANVLPTTNSDAQSLQY